MSDVDEVEVVMSHTPVADRRALLHKYWPCMSKSSKRRLIEEAGFSTEAMTQEQIVDRIVDETNFPRNMNGLVAIPGTIITCQNCHSEIGEATEYINSREVIHEGMISTYRKTYESGVPLLCHLCGREIFLADGWDPPNEDDEPQMHTVAIHIRSVDNVEPSNHLALARYMYYGDKWGITVDEAPPEPTVTEEPEEAKAALREFYVDCDD